MIPEVYHKINVKTRAFTVYMYIYWSEYLITELLYLSKIDPSIVVGNVISFKLTMLLLGFRQRCFLFIYWQRCIY
jgi:hypothetical protein